MVINWSAQQSFYLVLVLNFPPWNQIIEELVSQSQGFMWQFYIFQQAWLLSYYTCEDLHLTYQDVYLEHISVELH